MVIYITTNLVNGKKYIGKDAKNYPNYLGSGKLLSKAISKYGKENFKKDIIAYADNLKDLDKLEIHYISEYNADKSPEFYNLAKGGTGGKLLEESHLSKKLFQYSLQGNFIKEWKNAREAADFLNGHYSKINAVARGVRRSAYKFIWKYNFQGDIIPDYKTGNKVRKKTITLEKVKKPNIRYIKVYQYDNSGKFLKVFSSVSEVNRLNPEFKVFTIRNILLKNKSNFAYGFFWFNNYKGLFIENTIPIKANCELIGQFDLQGKLIKVWPSMAEAGTFFGAKKGTNIGNCITGHCKTAYGYKWKKLKYNK